MYAEKLILGEIITKLKHEIFSVKLDSNQFEKNCHEREFGIKYEINMCMEQLTELALTPGVEKLTKRQKLKSLKCLENLSKYVSELLEELDENKIKEYCNEINSNSRWNFEKMSFKPDTVFMMQNSFYTAISTEILWAPMVTVMQAMKISRGQLDLEELGNHLPGLLNKIENEVLPYLKNSSKYSTFFDSINEALSCYGQNMHRGCNLIIMISIEGIVRRLANFLAIHQEMDSNFSEEQYNSLNSLLRDVKWKEDFKIDKTTLSLIIGDSKTNKEKRTDRSYLHEEYEFVNLNTRLDFLKGRFKDDRDLILHGSNQEYNKKWNLFLNFSALYEVYKVVRYYDNLYDPDNSTE